MDKTLCGKALAHPLRVEILDWLRRPGSLFAHQTGGDPREVGVCVSLIAERAAVSQSTISEHLAILKRAGFVKSRKIGRWSYYRRDGDGLRDFADWVLKKL
ncbi:ArsR/SmtB family transcription factor [Algihabitans albus]|uniref:ArsR/SmtB family transcription factor n=1 Tax=Algihabitans albus TaxID=2164067 RepID=UPI000E5CD51D|nr:metalloregulator ArsR/SmtB family transcription factor [Algihabitans albus]